MGNMAIVCEKIGGSLPDTECLATRPSQRLLARTKQKTNKSVQTPAPPVLLTLELEH
jgi:hypothetical protein